MCIKFNNPFYAIKNYFFPHQEVQGVEHQKNNEEANNASFVSKAVSSVKNAVSGTAIKVCKTLYLDVAMRKLEAAFYSLKDTICPCLKKKTVVSEEELKQDGPEFIPERDIKKGIKYANAKRNPPPKLANVFENPKQFEHEKRLKRIENFAADLQERIDNAKTKEELQNLDTTKGHVKRSFINAVYKVMKYDFDGAFIEYMLEGQKISLRDYQQVIEMIEEKKNLAKEPWQALKWLVVEYYMHITMNAASKSTCKRKVERKDYDRTIAKYRKRIELIQRNPFKYAYEEIKKQVEDHAEERTLNLQISIEEQEEGFEEIDLDEEDENDILDIYEEGQIVVDHLGRKWKCNDGEMTLVQEE